MLHTSEEKKEEQKIKRNDTDRSCTITFVTSHHSQKIPRPFHIFLSQNSPLIPAPPSNIFLVPSSSLFYYSPSCVVFLSFHQRQQKSNVLTNCFTSLTSLTPLRVPFNPKSHLDAVNQSHTIYFTISPTPTPPNPFLQSPKPFRCHPYPSLPAIKIHSVISKRGEPHTAVHSFTWRIDWQQEHGDSGQPSERTAALCLTQNIWDNRVRWLRR